MGYQRDQSFGGPTYRPASQQPSESEAIQPSVPPPLPPRAGASLLRLLSPDPPAYETAIHEYHSQPLSHSWSAQDPRERSTESLVPSEEGADGRRTLLLIYVHGFLGNETSFQSFPAHIHNLLTTRLVSTHTVHTKIYPRYKSRKAIEYARDDFSNWLCPHENPQTDVVLLGHSMGGILSAEVALLGPYSAASKELFRHRILGTVNFDTPFLGMHPGVIASGIGSLFKPKPVSPVLKPQGATGGGNASVPMPHEIATPNGSIAGNGLVETQYECNPTTSGYFPPVSQSQSLATSVVSPTSPISSLAAPPINDPSFDPPFPNDIRLPVRKGWESTLHFITKHSDGLTKATKSYVTSHLEFGGALADYRGLKARYERLRAFEDIDSSHAESLRGRKSPRRIRFVNYYTASTGRLPLPNAGSALERPHINFELNDSGPSNEQQGQDNRLSAASISSSRSASKSPRISIEDPHGDVVANIAPETEERNDEFKQGMQFDQSGEMNHVEPKPATDDGDLREGLMIDDKTTLFADSRNISRPSSAVNIKVSTESPPLPCTQSSTLSQVSSLPPIPPPPTEPAPFDPSPYSDKDTRKLAEKDHARQTKSYQRAVKDRDKAIKDRRKLLEKREKVARQAREKAMKEEERIRVREEIAEMRAKEMLRAGQEREEQEQAADPTSASAPNGSDSLSDSGSAHRNPSSLTNSQGAVDETKAEKKMRDRKFCMLPPKVNGRRDACWPRVFMEGVDEVGAHCGLFVAGKPHYEGLVMDVGQRVEMWVLEKRKSG
ncbi:hypothetical protein MMC13_003573 [Lambiella insularis]|nr:hypothetical protein [Lambiella insularis]